MRESVWMALGVSAGAIRLPSNAIAGSSIPPELLSNGPAR